MRRTLGIALSAAMLAAPLMLLTAIAIRLDSPGPIFYRQERVGENDRLFTLCKFRSMRCDAEQGTPIWAQNRDISEHIPPPAVITFNLRVTF